MLTDMRPDLVMQLLSDVEHKWVDGATQATRGNMDVMVALHRMQESCVKVSNSVVAGSDGDRRRVREYMNEVCERAKSPNDGEMCKSYSTALVTAMNGDEEYNREELDMAKFCAGFYQKTIQGYAAGEAKRLDALEVEMAKKTEAADKLKAEQEALAKKKAAEQAEAAKKAKAQQAIAAKKAAAKKAEEQAVAKKAKAEAAKRAELAKKAKAASKAKETVEHAKKAAVEAQKNAALKAKEATVMEAHSLAAEAEAQQEGANAKAQEAQKLSAKVHKEAEDHIFKRKVAHEGAVAALKKARGELRMADERELEEKKRAAEKAVEEQREKAAGERRKRTLERKRHERILTEAEKKAHLAAHVLAKHLPEAPQNAH